MRIDIKRKCCPGGCFVEIAPDLTVYASGETTSRAKLIDLGAEPPKCVALCQNLRLMTPKIYLIGAASFNVAPWRTFCSRVRHVVQEHLGELSDPICLIPGNSEPANFGIGSYYISAAGAIVRHPNAYRRAGGKPEYVASTARIEVGYGWLDLALKSDKLQDSVRPSHCLELSCQPQSIPLERDAHAARN